MSLKIGLIGCGRWGKNILRDLLALNAEVHVSCLGEQSIQGALEKGAATAGRKIENIDQLDGFVVATPSATHAMVLRDLIGLSKPIYVEKPLTADVKSARELALCGKGQIFVMDKWRYHPAIEKARELALAGELGEILAIKTERLQWSQPHTDVDPLWILAPHDLSIALHILGFIPAVRSATATVAGRPELGLAAILGEAAGPQVHIDLGIASPSHRRSLSVIGSKGTFQMSGPMDDAITLRKGAPGDSEAVAEKHPIAVEMPLFNELRAFTNYVAGTEGAPMSSVEDGLLIVERISQIEEMVTKGRVA